MNIIELKKNLTNAGYVFKVENNTIKIFLDFNHYVFLKYEDKIIINDKFQGWNFLTGTLSMSIKNSVIYNFIGILLFGFINLYSKNVKDFDLSSLYLLYIGWVILFSFYYLIKLESLKLFIQIKCNKEL